MSRIPKKPTEGQYIKLCALVIDTTKGSVYNLNGVEIGHYNRSTKRYCIGVYADGRTTQIARAYIIWWKHYRCWPKIQLDHKDRNGTNDRIDNLREGTGSQNGHNAGPKPRRNQKAIGLPKGVCIHKRNKNKPYLAQILVQYKLYWLGCFATVEEATEARRQAEIRFGLQDWV